MLRTASAAGVTSTQRRQAGWFQHQPGSSSPPHAPAAVVQARVPAGSRHTIHMHFPKTPFHRGATVLENGSLLFKIPSGGAETQAHLPWGSLREHTSLQPYLHQVRGPGCLPLSPRGRYLGASHARLRDEFQPLAFAKNLCHLGCQSFWILQGIFCVSEGNEDYGRKRETFMLRNHPQHLVEMQVLIG